LAVVAVWNHEPPSRGGSGRFGNWERLGAKGELATVEAKEDNAAEEGMVMITEFLVSELGTYISRQLDFYSFIRRLH
jgi:hypothetical protein